jgi:penicillin-binding protein 2
LVRKRFDVQKELQTRVNIYSAVLLLAFAIILARLWYMQVLSADDYRKLADNNRLRKISTEAVRGNIYDRNGKLLVTSRPSLTITAIPYILEKYPWSKLNHIKLSKIPHKEVNNYLKATSSDPLAPKVIIRDADPKLVYYIKEHSDMFPGIKVEVLPVRSYPNGKLAAHVLGYVGEVSDLQLTKGVFQGVELGEMVGKDGVEFEYNSTLMGVRGQQIMETNSMGRPTRTLKNIKAIPGSSVVLTIDKDIQKATENALEQAVKAAKTKIDPNNKKHFLSTAGAAVVLDARNGEIIAMSSYPTYDPRMFIGGIKKKQWAKLIAKNSHYPMNNRAYTSLYPPASTFKPITAIASIQEGLSTPGTPFTCIGEWRKWNQTFRCWKKTGHGNISLVRALVESCDVYFYNIGALLYQSKKKAGEPLQYWARKFGLGEKTGVPLPNEGAVTAGRVPTKSWKASFNRMNGKEYQLWYPGDTINMSIGQGDLLVTPLQLANVYTVIANGGTLYKPQIVKAVKSPTGDIKTVSKPKIKRKIKIKKSALDAVRQGLKGVVQGAGTAAGAFSGFNVKVAGKTGTAQIRNKQDTALFVGYAPADNPKYVVAVIVEEAGHGGSVAAPAAREIFSAIFNKGKSTTFKVVTGVND